MSVLTLSALRARIETPVGDGDLQALLDSIEQDIVDVIGNPYESATADISETHAGYGRDLFLARRVLSVTTVTEYDSLTDATGTELTENVGFAVWPKQGRLERIGGKWGAKVTVEYVPADDRLKWMEAEIDLVRLRLAHTAMKAESVGGELSYTAPDNWEKEKRRVIERLMFPRV